MLFGQAAAAPRPSRCGDAIERPIGVGPAASGMASNDLPDQPQLAGPVNPRMAGQHLLDQRRARTRQAEDEHRPTRLGLPAPVSRGRTIGRILPAAGRRTSDARRDCNRGGRASSRAKWRSPRAGIRRPGHSLHGRPGHAPGQTAAWRAALAELFVGQTLFKRGQVRVRQFAAQQRRQPGMGQGEVGLQLQGPCGTWLQPRPDFPAPRASRRC